MMSGVLVKSFRCSLSVSKFFGSDRMFVRYSDKEFSGMVLLLFLVVSLGCVMFFSDCQSLAYLW